MIKYRLTQALKEEQKKTRRRILKVVLAVIVALYLAVNVTCAYPIFGWHPNACLCNQCLAEFEADRVEGEQR